MDNFHMKSFLFPCLENIENYVANRYKLDKLYILIFYWVSMSFSTKSGDCKWVSLKTGSAKIRDFFILNKVEKNVINVLTCFSKNLLDHQHCKTYHQDQMVPPVQHDVKIMLHSLLYLWILLSEHKALRKNKQWLIFVCGRTKLNAVL